MSGDKAVELLARKLCKQQADATIQKIQDPISKQLFHRSEYILRVLKKDCTLYSSTDYRSY